ncbi:MAG: RNase P modulator RnpM [Christensenellales bacterium]
MKKRRIPMRMCMGCREKRPKKELLRVVKSPEGIVSADATGKAAGRGAYICPDAECLKRAMKSRALERELEVKIAQEVYDALLHSIEEMPR